VYHIMQSGIKKGAPQLNLQFWSRNVVQRGICYQNVCLSVCPSVRYTRRSRYKRFKLLKYCTFLQSNFQFSTFKSRNSECRGLPRRSALKTSSPCRQRKLDH